MSESVRQANGRIAEYAIRMKFVSRVPFICECDDPGCREFILLHPDDYTRARRGAYVTLPQHHPPEPRAHLRPEAHPA